jgi:hypothetical protein
LYTDSLRGQSINIAYGLYLKLTDICNKNTISPVIHAT